MDVETRKIMKKIYQSSRMAQYLLSMIDLIDKIGNTMKNLIKYFKRVDGQSLAEFAVTTAMMATLATTAAPKFSGVGEGAKEKKTLADIDKILKSANNFYNSEVTTSGRGRFPGQGKYNETVPFQSGYTYAEQKDAKDAVDAVLDKETGSFNSFDNVGDIQNWVSVFGTNNPDAPLPSDAGSLNNSEDPDDTYYENGIVTPKVGAEEFLDGFGGAPIKSPSRMDITYILSSLDLVQVHHQ